MKSNITEQVLAEWRLWGRQMAMDKARALCEQHHIGGTVWVMTMGEIITAAQEEGLSNAQDSQ